MPSCFYCVSLTCLQFAPVRFGTRTGLRRRARVQPASKHPPGRARARPARADGERRRGVSRTQRLATRGRGGAVSPGVSPSATNRSSSGTGTRPRSSQRCSPSRDRRAVLYFRDVVVGADPGEVPGDAAAHHRGRRCPRARRLADPRRRPARPHRLRAGDGRGHGEEVRPDVHGAEEERLALLELRAVAGHHVEEGAGEAAGRALDVADVAGERAELGETGRVAPAEPARRVPLGIERRRTSGSASRASPQRGTFGLKSSAATGEVRGRAPRAR